MKVRGKSLVPGKCTNSRGRILCLECTCHCGTCWIVNRAFFWTKVCHGSSITNTDPHTPIQTSLVQIPSLERGKPDRASGLTAPARWPGSWARPSACSPAATWARTSTRWRRTFPGGWWRTRSGWPRPRSRRRWQPSCWKISPDRVSTSCVHNGPNGWLGDDSQSPRKLMYGTLLRGARSLHNYQETVGSK